MHVIFKNLYVFAAICFWLILGADAKALIVTQAQIAQAVIGSSATNAFFSNPANAAFIAGLATNVESSAGNGTSNTAAWNGGCCYGVLQLTRSNIHAYVGSNVTGPQFAAMSLQDQVTYWEQLTADGMKASGPKWLIANMGGTFDGQPIDTALVLACVQLGPGSCGSMVNDGSCNSFKDTNGTTICAMAAKMRAAVGVSNPDPVATAALNNEINANSGNGTNATNGVLAPSPVTAPSGINSIPFISGGGTVFSSQGNGGVTGSVISGGSGSGEKAPLEGKGN